ncbi:MAG TPA: chemotaxis protein CheW [Myxococcales bacterium]|jgi:purine-binding chemotaxis protein CheW|nr:chemotaxis protein CheW [Myxococcales bacterium]
MAPAPPFPDQLQDFFFRPDEPPLPGLELPEVAVAPEGPEPEPIHEYLAFALDRECYGVPITAVREIVRVPVLTEVPRSGPDLLGVINLRGEVLPVYDLKLRLHLQATPAKVAGPEASPDALPRSARVLVIRGGDQGDVGVLVDGVSEVVRIPDGELEPAPAGTTERDCIVGLGRLGEQLCILLDLERALA